MDNNVDPIGFAVGTDARLGGLDLTISLTRAEAAALGGEAQMLVDWLHTALQGLAMLRTRETAGGEAPDADDWARVVTATHHRLTPRIEGIRDGAVRAHAEAGGTYGQLAAAMDTPRATAQYLRDRKIGPSPAGWEDWAINGGPRR